MDVVLWICVLWGFENAILSANAQTPYSNLTTASNDESATVIPTIFNSTTPEDTSNTSLPESTETSFNASTTDNPGRTEPTETVTENFTSTEVSLETTAIATQPTPTISGSQPLPISGSLPPPVTDVSRLCPCNLQEGRCDVNCCCDQDCVWDFKLFTECKMENANTQLCSQDTARYSLSTAADGSAEVQASLTQEVSSDVFCIYTANYGAGLSFAPPEVPTDGNFDNLFKRFVGFFFDTTGNIGVPNEQDPKNLAGYKYGDVIQTQNDMGERGFLRLPTPAGSAHCTDANPAAFLQDQTSRCVRSFRLEQDCETLPSLNLQTYTSFRILSGKTENRTLLEVDLSSVTLQSLGGARVRVDPADQLQFGPALLEAGEGEGAVCNNVVLQVSYRVTYGEAGEITGVATSAVLGAVNRNILPILQEFTVTFIQDTEPRELPSSGNPGYVVGLPLVAGTRTAEGVVRSADRNGGLTLLQSPSAEQGCLGATVLRTPVQFGVNVASGCTLRLVEAANCLLVSELILGVLRGPDFPKFVASFGNSPASAVLDWVPIKNRTSSTSDAESCRIPLSLDLEVKWTKYGSLVNPQAQIVSVTEVIQTNSSSLASLLGGSDVLLISTSVTFIDVSASAQPGYRAAPTIDAKLPYDFFFPFV